MGAARASAARSPQPRAPQGTIGSPRGRAEAVPSPPLRGKHPRFAPPGSTAAFFGTPPPAGPPGQGLSPQRGAPRLVRASPAPRLPAPFPRRSSARRLPPRLLPHREGGSAELPGTARHNPAYPCPGCPPVLTACGSRGTRGRPPGRAGHSGTGAAVGAPQLGGGSGSRLRQRAQPAATRGAAPEISYFF